MDEESRSRGMTLASGIGRGTGEDGMRNEGRESHGWQSGTGEASPGDANWNFTPMSQWGNCHDAGLLRTMEFMESRAILPAVLVALMNVSPARASEASFAGLLANSPFGQVHAEGNSPAATAVPVEFRGFVVEGTARIYSLSEPEHHRSCWLRENETDGNITVRHFDERSATLRIEYKNIPLILVINKSVPRLAGPMPNPATGSEPTAETEAPPSRLELLAAEARWRRAHGLASPAGNAAAASPRR